MKHSSFGLPADDKPMQNDQVHAMPWQWMFALYVHTTISMALGICSVVYYLRARTGANVMKLFTVLSYTFSK
jgi:hypothetical protein